MPTRRSSVASSPKLNLYCAQCDSQIGIFENEWEHLTSSYAKPKEKGISFAVDIGDKTQIVPHGTSQKTAEGCLMSEVFCKKCSTMVAQYCRSAPHSGKEYLVNQQFYKLSRIYLKDAQTSERLEPQFVDDEVTPSHARPGSVRSSLAPPPPSSRQRPASVHGSTQPPSFRQSFPPPTQSQSHAASQPDFVHFSSPVEAEQSSRQQQFAPSQSQPTPQMQQVPYSQHQQLMYHGPLLDQFQQMAANNMQMLPREVVEQGAAITECFSRIAGVEGRIATEVTRINTFETSLAGTEEKVQKHAEVIGQNQKALEQLRTGCRNSRGECQKHDELIQQQQAEIEQQQEQLRNTSEKLESLQKSMDELKETMEEMRSQSLVQSAPRPDSRDFLENLEVMVRAMRDARSSDQQVQALREENKAMKARLKSIASAMGQSNKDDDEELEDADISQELEDLQTLGKRKRETAKSDQRPRKASRSATGLRTASHESVPSMPTPESTQQENHPSIEGQQDAKAQEEATVEDVRVESDASRSPIHESDDYVLIGDSDDAMEEQQDNDAASKNVQNGLTQTQPTEPRAAQLNDDLESAARQQSIAEADQASSIVVGLHPTDPDARLAVVPRGFPGAPSMLPPASYYHQYAAPSFFSTPAPYSAHYRPGFAGRSSTMHFLSAPGAMPAYFGTTLYSPSQTPQPSFVMATPDPSSNDTFSGALSRGQRLEEIVPRPVRGPSVARLGQPQRQNAPSAAESSTAVHPNSSTMQPAREVQTFEQSTKTATLAAAEAIDFSDEEAADPSARPSSAAQPTSTTPQGEPIIRPANGTLISRTVRGLTLEPLVRPVINEPPPKAAIRSDSFSRSVGSRAPSIMPEFMTAIHNLNGSAARHAATTSVAAAPPRVSAASASFSKFVGPPVPAPVSKPAVDHSKKSRKSEPMTRVAVDVAQTPASESSEGISQVIQKENIPPTDNKPAEPMSVTAIPEAVATRGRPRKSGRPSDNKARGTEAAPAQENDDECAVCGDGGPLICCDSCPKVYHRECLRPQIKKHARVPDPWYCIGCAKSRKDGSKAATTLGSRSQLDEKILRERNRLAQEAMDKEVAAERRRR